VTAFSELQRRLASRPRTWLITGVAGFIGSNLLETLLNLDQSVVGLDNFATGFRRNLGEVQDSVRATYVGQTIAAGPAQASIMSCIRRRSAVFREA
jgi:nucleoside-diphosphate-sugar epimerase